MIRQCDWLVIGAGIYGLYAASRLCKKNKVIILEFDNEPFSRASYINQARVHNGYHYPRSYFTAKKSSNYFARFVKDFEFAINKKFTQIYAIAKKYSFTSAEHFEKFCNGTNILCKEIDLKEYFKTDEIEAAFETNEYAFDANEIKKYFLKIIDNHKRVNIFYNVRIKGVDKQCDKYIITLQNGDKFVTPNVLNATYASINQIINLFNFDIFKIKYEICEIMLCSVSDNIKNIGITVMDGPFFSLMPFGLSDYHSLTSVTFTPHLTSYEDLPIFRCQLVNKNCTANCLQNCNICPARPNSAWIYMNQLAKKFLDNSVRYNYRNSLFSIKPILMASEIDDSRPTLIRKFSDNPTFISILSGKINTIYDLDNFIQ